MNAKQKRTSPPALQHKKKSEKQEALHTFAHIIKQFIKVHSELPFIDRIAKGQYITFLPCSEPLAICRQGSLLFHFFFRHSFATPQRLWQTTRTKSTQKARFNLDLDFDFLFSTPSFFTKKNHSST